MDKKKYKEKLDMVNILISEFRSNASLWSVKKQIEGILSSKQSKEEML